MNLNRSNKFRMYLCKQNWYTTSFHKKQSLEIGKLKVNDWLFIALTESQSSSAHSPQSSVQCLASSV